MRISWFLTFGVFFIFQLLTACSPGARIARNQPIHRPLNVGSAEFKQSIATATQSRWTDGNSITTLVNGDAYFGAMLESIRSAKKSITFETYAFVEGAVAQSFTNAFCERARHGVKIHIIVDAAGSVDFGETNTKRLKDAGAELTFYHPFRLIHPMQYNTRDHRKLMVVDGNVGFTGGGGVGDAWLGNAETIKNWRETHFKLTGPIVAQIQHAFVDNWIHTGGKQLTGRDYFPPLEPTGQLVAQVFNASPKDKNYPIPHVFRQAFASAQKSIIIENSYFSPDKPIIDEILAARRRGVHVELIVPGVNTDAWPVRTLTRGLYAKLLRAGVHIYEYQQTMMHCKSVVIDSTFSIVGSANFDPRSLYINDESNLHVLSKPFALEQLQIIDDDKKRSVRILEAPSVWDPRTLPKRIAAGLLATQL